VQDRKIGGHVRGNLLQGRQQVALMQDRGRGMEWYHDIFDSSLHSLTPGPEPVLNTMPEQFDALEMGPEKHERMNRTLVLLKLITRPLDI
jgi:hypothetical protein